VDFNNYRENTDAIYVKRSEAVQFEFDLYPSPVQDVLIIEIGSEITNAQVRISDLGGKTWVQSFITEAAANSSQSIDTSNLPSGVYVVQLQAGLQSEYRKIVKE